MLSDLLNGLGTAFGIIVGFAVLVAVIWLLIRYASSPRQQIPPPGNIPAGAPPNTPVVQVTRINWTLGFPSSPFWKWLWTIGILAIASAVAWYIYTHFSKPTITTPTLPAITLPSWNTPDIDLVSALLLVAMVIALVVTFVVGDRKKLLTYAFVTVLLLFVVAQYKNDGIYLGYRRDILYLLAITAIVLVATYATKGKERTTFGLLVVAVFILLGFSHIYTWDQFINKLNSTSLSGGSQVASATSVDCDGHPTTFTYRLATYRVNDKVCQLRGMVLTGCVTWLDSNNRYRGYSCEGEKVPAVDGISRLKPDTTAVVTLNYCKPFAPGNLVEKCA